MEMKGGCLCGAVRITLSSPVALAEFCHCTTCRRATGAPVMAWAGVARHGVEIEGKTLQRFESTPAVERTFCGRCGTSLTIWDRNHPDHVYVAIAALKEAESCAPEVHIWRSERLSWIETSDSLPRYARFKRDGVTE